MRKVIILSEDYRFIKDVRNGKHYCRLIRGKEVIDKVEGVKTCRLCSDVLLPVPKEGFTP